MCLGETHSVIHFQENVEKFFGDRLKFNIFRCVVPEWFEKKKTIDAHWDLEAKLRANCNHVEAFNEIWFHDKFPLIESYSNNWLLPLVWTNSFVATALELHKNPINHTRFIGGEKKLSIRFFAQNYPTVIFNTLQLADKCVCGFDLLRTEKDSDKNF